ncbi:TIGR03751 family conjugal transfer lipoprotein [Pseudomonas aeruginosa]|uniref:TIGR03751 family conjugal transfer lipoprotein n=1 Tax=Pseudomonas aeruginosa TaxID=287 RepID=UPI003F773320|nr:TIGR03751 family conjugal transfer lipoprotein [Pseudomonas aeruginosa]
MPTIWTKAKSMLLFALLTLLTACATDKDRLLAHNGGTMLDVWEKEAGGRATGGQASRELLDARLLLRRPLPSQQSTPIVDSTDYSRTAQNEIYRQFHRLPNPDLVMYVFPHLAGTDPVPVPGYTTVFPLYQRVQYALPGERLEDY